MRILISALLCACVVAAPASAKALPKINHVFVVVLENKDYADIFGPGSQAPYLGGKLVRKGALLPNYYGIGHHSLDNYIAMISGQAPNPDTQADCGIFNEFAPATPVADGQFAGTGCVYPTGVKTLADQLTGKKRSWAGYMEDMANGAPADPVTCRHPVIGTPDLTEGARLGDQYATKHNPFVYFHSIVDSPICQKNVVDFSEFAGDLKREKSTPDFSFIVPNLCNDGHDSPCIQAPAEPGGIPRIEAFLRQQVPPILRSDAYKDNGLLIITFDEAEDDSTSCCNELPGPNTAAPGGSGPGGGRVGAVLLSPCIKPKTTVNTAFNHYSLLRSIEKMFKLPYLGFAAQSGLKTFDGAFDRKSCAS